jgi:hypothetical protein
LKLAGKALTFVAGMTIKRVINYAFDYVAYPVVLLALGNVRGAVFLTLAAVAINIIVIRLYDWSRIDWFLIENIKKLQNGENAHTRFRFRPSARKRSLLMYFALYKKNLSNLCLWLLQSAKKSSILTFFVLCLDDPVTVTLYFREGNYKFNGLSLRDWKIFIAANIVSNMYWIAVWLSAIEAIKWLFK